MNYISLKRMQLLFPCSKCAYEQKHELLLMLSVRKAQLLPLKKMSCIRHNINMADWAVFALTKKRNYVSSMIYRELYYTCVCTSVFAICTSFWRAAFSPSSFLTWVCSVLASVFKSAQKPLNFFTCSVSCLFSESSHSSFTCACNIGRNKCSRWWASPTLMW